ncbi:tail fiber domain-containing protein [Spirosoma validum]|uniref:Tail fiber domain-containing protein n=1 Tax=Spirosoma validum TaxID=2771355 RepID=A0A927B5A1_9BACT|nr:tail fiber domain-containing protein [Spirosoma validum]MBD2755914.1 tail fiber domain-containing protein [Spirosoma validum]
MKSFYLVALLALISTSLHAQVGIGTTTPKSFFNVAADKEVLFGGSMSGTGSKLIWYPVQGSFRVGYIDGSQWDPAQIGVTSFAAGRNTIASGQNATALGFSSIASGLTAIAMGQDNAASGNSSVTIGDNNTASGSAAIAIGRGNLASSLNSIAIGYGNTSSRFYSTAIGNTSTANGYNSMALGIQAIASGDYSTAMGNYVSTTNQNGSFIIGDLSTDLYSNTTYNQMMMRFRGGYILYSTAPASQAAAVGVKLAPGSNAWQTLSDSTRKENFRSVDGASFLNKIASLRLGSWNYKGQDVKQYRHYGPMAQDFFAAFGHDELGIIGEAKSINQADFDGVNLIAIQALIKEVQQLKADNSQLKAKVETYEARFNKLESGFNLPSDQSVITLKPLESPF